MQRVLKERAGQAATHTGLWYSCALGGAKQLGRAACACFSTPLSRHTHTKHVRLPWAIDCLCVLQPSGLYAIRYRHLVQGRVAPWRPDRFHRRRVQRTHARKVCFVLLIERPSLLGQVLLKEPLDRANVQGGQRRRGQHDTIVVLVGICAIVRLHVCPPRRPKFVIDPPLAGCGVRQVLALSRDVRGRDAFRNHARDDRIIAAAQVFYT